MFVAFSFVLSLGQVFSWRDMTCNFYFKLCFSFIFSWIVAFRLPVVQEPFLSFGKNNTLQRDQKLFRLLTHQFLSPRWKKSALNSLSEFLFNHTVSVRRSPYTAVPPRADLSAGGIKSWVDQGFKAWVQALCSSDEAT